MGEKAGQRRMKKEHLNEIQGIIVLAFGLILLASFISFVPDDLAWFTSQPNSPAHNLIRIVGAYTAGTLFFIFGYSAYALVLFFFFWSWNKFSQQDLQFSFSKLISALVLFCVISSLLSMTGDQGSIVRFGRGGLTGFVTADFLSRYLGRTGAYIILMTMGSLTLVLTGEFLVSPLLFKLTGWLQELMVSLRELVGEYLERRQARRQAASLARPRRQPVTPGKPARPVKGKPVVVEAEDDEEEEEYEEEEYEAEAVEDEEEAEDDEDAPAAQPTASRPRIHIANPKKDPKTAGPAEPKVVGEYVIPSLDLLASAPEISTSKLQSDLESGARILETTLNDFNVKVRVADIERGPVITRYELEPAPGVKVQRIITLSDDIALAMKAAAVRIVAPIPGQESGGDRGPQRVDGRGLPAGCLGGQQFSKFQIEADAGHRQGHLRQALDRGPRGHAASVDRRDHRRRQDGLCQQSDHVDAL